MDLFQLGLLILTALALTGLILSNILLRKTLSSYASEKGKNLATKEDISDITNLIESTKISLNELDRYAAKNYELKYQACLNALSIIDAQMSHAITSNDTGQPLQADKQYANAKEMRACHNELILSVKNPVIVSTFMKIITGPQSNPIAELNHLRRLIRTELEFTGDIHVDDKNTWIAISSAKENIS